LIPYYIISIHIYLSIFNIISNQPNKRVGCVESGANYTIIDI